MSSANFSIYCRLVSLTGFIHDGSGFVDFGYGGRRQSEIGSLGSSNVWIESGVEFRV